MGGLRHRCSVSLLNKSLFLSLPPLRWVTKAASGCVCVCVCVGGWVVDVQGAGKPLGPQIQHNSVRRTAIVSAGAVGGRAVLVLVSCHQLENAMKWSSSLPLGSSLESMVVLVT